MREKTWSIIIPARNEEKVIGQCLDSLAALQFDLASVEVIVANNGSTDRTAAIAESYSVHFDVVVADVPGVAVGAVRNAAVSRSSGRFLAFLDADCMVAPGWLQAATVVLGANPDTIVGAPYALPPDAGWPARVWHERFHEGKRGPVSYLPGGNLIMEKELFQRVGGFDPALRSNEDSQFCSRARSAGFRILAFPELAAVHLGAERDLPHFIRRQLWHGSNVVNRAALRGNARAIGLAAYTLICALWLLTGWMFGPPVLLVLPVLAMLAPPFLLALRRADGEHLRHFPQLVTLLLAYSLTRAFVLPLACWRGAREWSFQSK